MNVAIMAGGPSSERVISLQTAANISNKLEIANHQCFTIDVNGSTWIYNNSVEDINIDKNDFSLLLPNGKIYFDYVVIAIHGKQGEDGLLQAYFEIMQLPYSTCDVMSSALTYDKIRCKQYLKVSGNIPMADQVIVRKGDNIIASEIVEKLRLPVFVKPNTAGSSFGVTKVYDENDLEKAILQIQK